MILTTLEENCELCKSVKIQYYEPDVITAKGCSNSSCKLFLPEFTQKEIELLSSKQDEPITPESRLDNIEQIINDAFLNGDIKIEPSLLTKFKNWIGF